MSRVRIIKTICILLFVLALTSQATALIKPQPQRAILPNGLRVVVQEDHSLPLVSCKVLFKVGPGAARAVSPGLVSILARMLEIGSPTGESRENMVEELARHGCQPPQVIDIPSGLILMVQGPSESQDAILKSLRKLAFGLTFSREEFDRAKNLELQKARQRKQFPLASGYLCDAVAPMLFEGLPMGVRFHANQDEIGKIGLAEVEKLYREQCVANNAALVIVGDVMACDIFKGLMPVFGDLTAPPQMAAVAPKKYEERADEKTIAHPDAKCTASILETREYLDIKTTQVCIGFPAPAFDDIDCAAASVWVTAMTHINDSWLARLQRQDFPKLRNLTARYLPNSQKGMFCIQFESPDANVDPIVSSLLRKLAALWRVPPRDAELQRIIANCKSLRSLQSEFRSVQGIALGIGELEGDFSLNDSVWASIETVSADDLARAARKMFTSGVCAVRIAHPQDAKARQDTVVRSETLKNGLQMVVKPYGGSDVVAICLRIGEPGGSFHKPMKGLPELVFRMIEAQTNAEARDSRLARQLDEIGGLVHCQIIPGSGLYIVGYSGRDQFVPLMKNLKEQVFSPVLDNQLLSWAAGKLKNDRANALDQAPLILQEKFTSMAFPGSEWRHSLVPPENVGSIKLSEVQEFQRAWVQPGNMLCTVVGNVDPEEGLRLAKEVFAEVPGGSGREVGQTGTAFLRGLEKTSEAEIKLPAGAGSAYLAGGYRMPPVRASRLGPVPLDFITLGALMHRLARGESCLLQQELVKKGLAEAVEDVIYRHNSDASYLYFLVRVSPEKLDACRTALRQLLQKLPDTEVTQESIETAGKMVPTFLLQKMESSWFHAQTLAGFLAQGYAPDFFEKLPESFKQVKPEQIEQALKEHARHFILISGKP